MYYGKYGGNAMKYRVLDTAATEFNTNSTMLLDCDSTIENKIFDASSNLWSSSEIKGWLNGNEFYGSENVFTAQEKAAIASSTKRAAADGDGNGYQDLNYAPLAGEHVFLLDAKEATRPSYGYVNNRNDDDTRKKSRWWWLRSPCTVDENPRVGYVSRSGLISYRRVDNGGEDDVSPALNLNLESVIFSSEVSSGYKLTIADSGLGITPGTITRDGTTITVPYTITGTNKNNATQVSVLIMDSAYSAGTAATSGYSYQKLNVSTWGISGTGSFTLPDAYVNQTCGTDYFAYILAEDVNADTATDYASVPASIMIPDLPQVATPTFSPAAGTYTEAQNVTISCTTDGATIHYTTDGTAPTAASSTYNSPINVSLNLQIHKIFVDNHL